MTTIKGFGVERQDEGQFDVFKTEEEAIQFMEEYSGIKQEDWDYDDACRVNEDSDDLMFLRKNVTIHLQGLVKKKERRARKRSFTFRGAW